MFLTADVCDVMSDLVYYTEVLLLKYGLKDRRYRKRKKEEVEKIHNWKKSNQNVLQCAYFRLHLLVFKTVVCLSVCL